MTKSAPQEVVVGRYTRQRQEQIRCTVRHINGAKVLDLRVFYRAEDGEWRPNPRGISLSEQEWPQLRDVLTKLSKALRNGREGS